VTEIFETVIPRATGPMGTSKLKYHKPNGHLTPANRAEMLQNIKERKFGLIEMGYPEDDAQYLAESEVVPRFFITPATDLKREKHDTILQEFALQTLSEHKTLKRAMAFLEPYGISRSLWRQWITDNPDFREALERVLEDLGDYYEGMAHDRVATGMGSDRLLLSMMRAYNPKRFVERKELSGPDGGPIQYKLEGSKSRLQAKLSAIMVRVHQSSDMEIPVSKQQLFHRVESAAIVEDDDGEAKTNADR